MVQQDAAVQSDLARLEHGIQDGDFVICGSLLAHEYEFVSRTKQSQLQVDTVDEVLIQIETVYVQGTFQIKRPGLLRERVASSKSLVASGGGVWVV